MEFEKLYKETLEDSMLKDIPVIEVIKVCAAFAKVLDKYGYIEFDEK